MTTDNTSDMSAIQLGLPRITSLLRAQRSPHLSTPIVHISGTNGKGSVSAYLSSILHASKLSVGRFNSPHLVDEWDCLQLGGRTVDRRLYETTKSEVEQLNETEAIGATSFEILTATAFTIFARARPPLDLAVVEVGMGGLTDATNVVDSEHTLLSVITPIELDHQKFLGDTIAEIARVKAGIIKQGGEVVLAKQAHEGVAEVVQEVARQMGATVAQAGEGSRVEGQQAIGADDTPASPLVSLPLSSSTSAGSISLRARLPLPGDYQLVNSAAAVLAASLLRTSPRCLALLPSLSSITDDSIVSGVESTRWAGRLDWVDLRCSPGGRLLVDGAHNPSSALVLASYLASLPPSLAPTTLIIGLSSPRDPLSILTPLLGAGSRIRRVVCVPFSPPPSMPWTRATSPEDIAVKARQWGREGFEVTSKQSVGAAIEELAESEKALVAGSLYLAADVYRWVRARG